MKVSTAIKLVTDELERAQNLHGPWNSAHEGYAFILEEVDELWDEIKADRGTTHRGVSEAVQTAATALRYLVDLVEDEVAVEHKKKVVKYDSSIHGDLGRYSG